jgi:beta-galactosidase
MRRAAFAALLIAAALSAAEIPVPPEIENEQILGINKQPWHATMMPYASLAEALAARRSASSWARSLNGQWKFNWVPRPELRPADFYKPSYDVSAWKEIPVPSNWQLEGYGTPYYRNFGYTIKRDWPRVMSEPPKDWTAYEERNPVGSYRRDFDLPAKWEGRRIFVTFDGVDSAFFLWINGHYVGYSVNSRNPAEFDITRYVKPGRNMIAAEVYRYSAGTYLEDQDMWRLSGIFRNVTLWSAPHVRIRDFFVKTDLDAQYCDATLRVSAKVQNDSDGRAKARRLAVQVYTNDGRPVKGALATVDVPALAAGEETEVSVAIPVTNPDKWTAETPNLYTTVLTLTAVGEAGEIVSTRTGFRKIEIKGALFLINGVPVKLKGANRHENWPDTGHYVSEERMIRDLELLKQANCNHVRTSHYSDDPRWYELCDEYGIYLVAEANVEAHGYYDVLDREPRWEKAIVDRNVANVENFKNHASVVMWSLGNENGGGSNFFAAVKAVKAIDPDRPVHYEPFHGKDHPADVDSRMYTSLAGVEAAAKDPARTKPFYLCEYAHAMNNSMGSLGEYNDLFDKYPALLGGAIWEWEDQGIWNRRDPRHPFIAYGGGFGEVPNDRYFIHKGVVFSDRTPKPHYAEVKRVYQWIGFEAEDLAQGLVRVHNKYAFTNLNQFEGKWTLTEDGAILGQGALGRLDVPPGGSAVVACGYRKIFPRPGAEYFLEVSFALAKEEVWAEAGYEVAAAQFKLPVRVAAPVADPPSMKPLKLAQDAQMITVEGDGFSVTFDKAEGTIAQLTKGGVAMLAAGGGPKAYFWRAPHRNDDQWAERDWRATGIDALRYKALKTEAQQVEPATVRVEAVVQAEGRNNWSATHSAVYTVYGDGSIVVDNAFAFDGRRIPLARLGVRLLLDRRFDEVTYLGRGPVENYSDRKRGSDIGLYASTVKEQLTPYPKPMEAGNHEDVRWVALGGEKLPTLLAVSDSKAMQISALPYTDEQLAAAEYSADLPNSTLTALTLSAATLGVGSNSCGPRPLDEYIVWSEPAAFSYVLRLAPAGKNDLSFPARLVAPRDRVAPVLAERDGRGRVALECETRGARIEYAVDGGTWQAYSAPFEMKRAAVVSVRAIRPGFEAFSGAMALGPFDRRVAWKIVSATSALRDGDAVNAIDGNASTFWLSRPRGPQSMVIDFGEPIPVSAVMYKGRAAKEYEIYLSADGKDWGEPVAQGALSEAQEIRPARTETARFMKFVVVSGDAGVAELDVK